MPIRRRLLSTPATTPVSTRTCCTASPAASVLSGTEVKPRAVSHASMRTVSASRKHWVLWALTLTILVFFESNAGDRSTAYIERLDAIVTATDGLKLYAFHADGRIAEALEGRSRLATDATITELILTNLALPGAPPA